MKFNWKPERTAFLDFETQSSHNLRKGTLHQYMDDPSTRVLTCVVKVDGHYHRLGPYLKPEELNFLENVGRTHTLVAHNAPFDAAVWERVLKLPEADWFDTLPCARAAGLPGGLDRLGTSLFGRGKDKNGERLIDMLCIVKPGKRPAPVGPAHELLMEYNHRDVELLEEVYGRVRSFGESDVMTADRTINERGVPVHRPTLQRLHELMLANKEDAKERFAEGTGGANANSTKQVRAWLESKGFSLKSLNKSAVLSLLTRPEDFYEGDGDMAGEVAAMKEAVLTRKEVVGTGASKVATALEVTDSDDRIRDQLVYNGALPGRWSSRKLQVHNMPTIVGGSFDIKTMPLTLEAAQQSARALEEELKTPVSVAAVLSTVLRTAVRADNLLVVDYGAVEARGVAWVSGEQTMLSMYRDPKRSLYMDMAKRIFGRDIDKEKDYQHYLLAKAIILGCGYNMSGAKFEKTLAIRDISTAPLKAIGLSPQKCVSMYRETYTAVPDVWKAYNEASHSAVNGEPAYAGRCEFRMVGTDLHIVLPSGRPIVYRNARIELMVPAYYALYNMPPEKHPTVVYDHPKGYKGFLYGGKVCENVVQGLCRDLMAVALVRAEQMGLNVVLHVHDEIVCQAPESRFKDLLELMSDPPAWADGFPVLVEGYSGQVWTKNPKGYKKASALNGRVL